MRKCECGGKFQILGTGGFGDTIEIECMACGDFFDIEPDGLGMGGLEFVEAQMMDEMELDYME